MNISHTLTILGLTAGLGLSSSAFAQQAGTASTGAPQAQAQVQVQAQAQVQAWKYKSKKLDRAEVDALLAQPDNLVVVDVRRPDELTRIGGFPVYLSIQVKDLEKQLAYVPRERTVVTVSNHAGRAGAAADLLASKGFKVAGAIGSQDYEAQGGTVVKIAPPTPRAQ